MRASGAAPGEGPRQLRDAHPDRGRRRAGVSAYSVINLVVDDDRDRTTHSSQLYWLKTEDEQEGWACATARWWMRLLVGGRRSRGRLGTMQTTTSTRVRGRGAHAVPALALNGGVRGARVPSSARSLSADDSRPRDAYSPDPPRIVLSPTSSPSPHTSTTSFASPQQRQHNAHMREEAEWRPQQRQQRERE
ncbi:hypothetical protein B0H12DRAFT_1151060, partial [Mycena haematopus]